VKKLSGGILIIVFVFSMIVGIACAESPVVERQIMMAVESVPATLGSMQDAGYQRWTATTAAEKLVETLNADLTPLPGEHILPGIGGALVYVTDAASAPWQIVLIPDDAAKTLRIEGYGNDVISPIYTKEIPVPEWG